MPLFNICKLKPIEISVYLSFFPLFSLLPFEKRGKKGKRDKKNGDKFPFLLFFFLPLHIESSAPACRWHSFMGMREESPGSIGHPTSETRSYC